MKILHINTYDKGGGAETVVMQLLHYQSDSNLLAKKKTIINKKTIELPQSKIDTFFHLLDQLLWKFGIHKKFKRIFFIEDEWNCTYSKFKKMPAYLEADIIHLHNIHGGYFDLKALRKIAAEKKIVWTLHDMWSMTGGEAYTFENDNYKKGIAYTPFGNQYPLRNSIIDRRQYYMNLKKKVYASIASSIVFVPVSNWLNNCLHESYVYNQQLSTHVIHNGIDTNIFKINNEKNWKTTRLLIFNSNNPFKGAEIYKDILPHLPEDIEITIIGEKLTFDTTQKCTYLPFIKDRQELANCYNQHDILLFPSRAEALGLVAMEAMACGMCVFASNIGGIPEIIEDKKTGFLFSHAKELLELLEVQLSDLEQLRHVGKKASEAISTQFTLKKLMQNYDQLYEAILNRAG